MLSAPRVLSGTLLCLGLLATAADLRAHGGQYRGPGDVTPPGGGPRPGSGPGPTPARTPTPGLTPPPGPSPVSPPTPITGGAPRAGGRPTPATGGDVALSDDLTTWDYWWEFNKDPYLRLKDAVHSGLTTSGDDGFYFGLRKQVEHDTLRPSENQILSDIVPALKKALDATEQRDITSSCMIALAKVGRDGSGWQLGRDVFLPRLASPDQEIRETAALALGIAGIASTTNLDLLRSLAADTAAGRTASGGHEVNDRTRSFATYGLGLVAHANREVAVQQFAADTLLPLLESPALSSRNLKVAAIHALSLLQFDDVDASRALRSRVLGALDRYLAQDLGAGTKLIQAHVPTAVARLLGRTGSAGDVAARAEHVRSYLALLGDEKTNADVARSCALALGQLVEPCADEKAASFDACKLLRRTWREHKDAQARSFAVLALGQIGGAWCRLALADEFTHARKALEKPWVAMAIGVLGFAARDAAMRDGRTPDDEDAQAELLRTALAETKDPMAQSAFAVALGMLHHTASGDALRALLARNRAKDDLSGYLCIGLALMDDQRSIEDIHDVVQRSTRRPELLKQAAVALGRLGDKTAATELQGMLQAEGANLAKLSALASALAFIGDRRSIEPLRAMLFQTDLSELSRAFAGVALGGIADKEPLPWNSKIGTNMNYRAAVETLTDKTAGILDIL